MPANLDAPHLQTAKFRRGILVVLVGLGLLSNFYRSSFFFRDDRVSLDDRLENLLLHIKTHSTDNPRG